MKVINHFNVGLRWFRGHHREIIINLLEQLPRLNIMLAQFRTKFSLKTIKHSLVVR